MDYLVFVCVCVCVCERERERERERCFRTVFFYVFHLYCRSFLITDFSSLLAG